MQKLRQTNKTNCGQTCVAMLLDISIKEAEELIGHNSITTHEEVLKAICTVYPDCWKNDFFGKIKYRNRLTSKKRTYLCLHQNPKNSEQKHWTICYHGDIIDPSGREEKDLWPMVRYWIIRYEPL